MNHNNYYVTNAERTSVPVHQFAKRVDKSLRRALKPYPSAEVRWRIVKSTGNKRFSAWRGSVLWVNESCAKMPVRILYIHLRNVLRIATSSELAEINEWWTHWDKK